MSVFRRLGSLIAGTFGLDRSGDSTPPADTASDRAHEVARSRSPSRFLWPESRWPSHPRKHRRDQERERRARQIERGQLRAENGLTRKDGSR